MDKTVTQGIEIRGITKTYGKTTALENVSTVFLPETIYGLLGQNGAGKSTLLNLIANRQFPDAGEILADGIPVMENDRAQEKIYLMSEQTLYPEEMKIKEILKWSACFYPDFDMEKARELMDLFQVKPGKKFKSLSTGYSSIVKLIVALCVNTPYLFLDEPVLGLDANHRDIFYRKLLEKYVQDPCTIVISTHLIEEIAHLIENVVIIKDGRIIEDTNKDQLLSRGFTVSGKNSDVDTYLAGIKTDSSMKILGSDSLGTLKTAYILGSRRDIPQELEISSMNLQKLFVQMTGTFDRQEG